MTSFLATTHVELKILLAQGRGRYESPTMKVTGVPPWSLLSSDVKKMSKKMVEVYEIFFLKNAKNGFSSKKSVHDCVGLKTKVSASRLTKKYMKSTFGEKKMKLSPPLF